ncbi:pre-mRNA-splicing factor prp46 [Malassezia cuniculi]|uniref:Pre-mRNA-splicing factor prp46 n=1 Tax=Malassezia cuniculi TaxID=948313 RepID=A0AAF0J7H6_9BASI|nr:pre-mRNA-splicing factor prp46 [Malassezia cuniculi]
MHASASALSESDESVPSSPSWVGDTEAPAVSDGGASDGGVSDGGASDAGASDGGGALSDDDQAPAPAPQPTKKRKRMRPLALKPLSMVLTGLITALMRRDTYQFFCEPVNADEVPGYREVITHPMDLGTMFKKVNEREYPDLESFRADFLRVTRNAQLFNPPTSIFHTAAKRLETWGLRAIDREASVVADDAAFEDAQAPRRGAPQTRRRRTDVSYVPRSNSGVMRVGSARATAVTASAPDESPELRMLRRTLAYAGISRGALTGKNACTLRTNAKPKARLLPLPAALEGDGDASGDVEGARFVHLDDGSIDPDHVADVRSYIAQRVGARQILAPTFESVQHLPITIGAGAAPGEPGFVFPNARRGHPDALYAAVLQQPTLASENWSHVIEHELPCATPSQRPPPPFGAGTKNRQLPAVWPATRAGQDPLAGMRLNRRERELEIERDESNWTVYRPHLERLMGSADAGLYSNLPAWVAGDEALRPYATVAGGALVNAIREKLQTMPYSALGLPRTAQFVPRSSLQQLPLSLQMTLQGAQQTERLVDVVYGGVQGLALAQSIEAFARGAAELAKEPPSVKREPEHSGDAGIKDEPDSTSPLAAVSVAKDDARLLGEPLVEHVERLVNPLTGGLLGALRTLGSTLAQMHVPHVPDTPKPKPVHPLVDLLDDKDGGVAEAVIAAVPDALPDARKKKATLAECLYELLGPST